MKREELIKKYIEFFKSKQHSAIPSASLIPENDPTVLFTTAGMHPLVPFLLGQKHPSGKRLVNVQKCLRTGDIEEVGDPFHHTFFEMLGNWSLGDYFKEDAIKFSHEFLTKVLKISKEKIAVTVFEGDKNSPKDTESEKIWLSLGIPKDKIAFMPKENNWWGPAGETGPCGPDTEMFYYVGKGKPSKQSNPKTKPNEWVEIWNDVFMQYSKTKENRFEELKQKNVDTGMGLERTLAVLNKLEDNYQTEIFAPLIKEIEKISAKKYGKDEQTTRSMRIIADHLKAAAFILSEKVAPSNVDHGYIARRLIRRAIRHGKLIGIKDEETLCKNLALKIIEIYKKEYKELNTNREFILTELENEEKKFKNTLENGIKEFEKLSEGKKRLSGKEAFLLYQSYGFPIEMIKELSKEKGVKVDEEEYNKEFEHHQQMSRVGAEQKFKGGLADHSEETTRLHTATHLLHQALKTVLGDQVHQKGSNITPERLRFDFNFDRKLTNEEIKKVEELVNKQIQRGLKVTKEEMTIDNAKKKKAIGVFEGKYGDKVNVYTMGDFSKEICGGPHVNNTKEVGKFKILKEESAAAGIRRIKAVVE